MGWSGETSVVITGADGRVGRVLVPAFVQAGWQVTALSRLAVDVTRQDEVAEAMRAIRPGVVVNCAAQTDMEACESDPAAAHSVNAAAVSHLADACRTFGSHLVQLSTDYVFDGTKGSPYLETDTPRPLSCYGASKLQGECNAGPTATVIRIAWLFGPHGRSVLRTIVQEALAPSADLYFVDDRRGSPSSITMLAPVIVRLAAERVPGIVHLANSGSASYFELAAHTLSRLRRDGVRVHPTSSPPPGLDGSARRPADTTLGTQVLGTLGYPELPHWTEAVGAFLDEYHPELVPKPT